MQTVQPSSQQQHLVYDLEGSLLEACSCNVLCPCWIGEDPDSGNCLSFIAYHFDRGKINGIDIAGLSIINVCSIPGNVLVPKSWKVFVLVDEKASDEQMQALLDAYSGKLGGPLADLSQLVGEVIGVERVPIRHEVRQGTGELEAGEYVRAAMKPYHGGDGTITTLRDSIFSTIPGSPAYVSKSTQYRVNIPRAGFDWSFEGRNAIQGDYKISYGG